MPAEWCMESLPWLAPSIFIPEKYHLLSRDMRARNPRLAGTKDKSQHVNWAIWIYICMAVLRPCPAFDLPTSQKLRVKLYRIFPNWHAYLQNSAKSCIHLGMKRCLSAEAGTVRISNDFIKGCHPINNRQWHHWWCCFSHCKPVSQHTLVLCHD